MNLNVYALFDGFFKLTEHFPIDKLIEFGLMNQYYVFVFVSRNLESM
jgi:hypothetical protein